MDNESQGSVSKMIKNLRSETEAYRRNSNSGFPLRRDSVNKPSTSTSNEDSLHNTPKRSKIDSTTSNGTFDKTNPDSVPGSPWEWRKMRGDLIALKAKLSQQESTIKQLHNVRREMEELFQKEKKLLEIQKEEDANTIKQLELRVDIGRRTIQEAKAAQAHAERDLIQMKSKMESKIISLIQDNNKLTEELRGMIKQENKPDTVASSTKVSDNKITELEEELKIANKRVADLEAKLKEVREYQQKYELQNIELHTLKMKLEHFEAEKGFVDESKKFIQRAAKVNELEKELKQARDLINSLRQSVDGKLLLEEKMLSVEHRLKRTEELERQINQMESTQAELLAKISDYESIGIAGGPIALRRELSRLQNAELMLTVEGGELRSKVDSLQKNLTIEEKRHEETKKQLADSSNSYERLSKFAGRMQKKLTLVIRERDSYRQHLDTYEKEITSYQNNETPNLLNERIPALERTIEGYRELVAKLEADLEAVDGGGQRDENKKLREELDRLKGELEHRALKGDFNINTRILHYKMNPAAIAEQQAEEKQKALLQEVEQLRAAVASGNHGTPAVSSLQAQEIAELQQTHEIKISRLKEAFKASSHEYRQACYQLFGWRVDRTKEGQYKLASQYAESPDDFLFFIVNEDGVNMIETPFSATLTTFIERHLQRQHSVPMFLNAVQCELFDQQTVTHVVS